ncbi:MAG: glycosyltransferase, partial [Bacteroidota bacterium]
MRKKRIIVSVSNDLVTDQRVRKQCDELVKAGYEILLLGRVLSSSLSLERSYKVHRANLPFRKGALFYASLNVFLFFKILFSRCDLLWANDLDTLPANWLVSVLRGKKLIYDSHEYFTEVPEIQDRPSVKEVWQFFERTCIRKAQIIITVSPSIGDLLKSAYQLPDVLIVRNVPEGNSAIGSVTKADLGLDPDLSILLLQGNGINVNRGGE